MINWISLVWKIFFYSVAVHWSIVTIYVLLGLVGYFFYRKPQRVDKEENVILCITSKANKNVENSLFKSIDYHSAMFENNLIYVLIDEGSELQQRLVDFISDKKNVEIIKVPKSFNCKAIAKGRALQYFNLNYVEKDSWYCFIDDDNLLMDKKFLKEVPYYNLLGYKCANGILYPRLGKSKITFIADHLRYFDDLTIFRLGAFLKKPLNGLHGELLIIKGDILKEVGFDRYSITEDFAFANEISKKGIKMWQSESKVSILSPHNMKDFIKQRNRWYKGISNDITRSPILTKIFSGIRIIDWKVGVIGSWLLLPFWFLMPLPLWWIIFNTIGMVYYYSAYIQGIIKLGGLEDIIKYVYLIPICSTLENISPYYKTKEKGFVVIEK